MECEVTKGHSTLKDHERHKLVNVFQSFAILFHLLPHLCYVEILVLILQGLLLTVDSAGFDQVKLFDLFIELFFEVDFLIFEDTDVRICNEELALPRQANVEGEPLLSNSEEHLLLFHKHDGAHLENFDQVAHPKVQIFEAFYFLEVVTHGFFVGVVSVSLRLDESLDDWPHFFWHI